MTTRPRSFVIVLCCLLVSPAWAADETDTTPDVDEGTDTVELRSEARPYPVRVSGTEAVIVRYVGDNGDDNEGIYGDDDQFVTVRNLFYFRANSRFLDAGVRFDTTLFGNPPHGVGKDSFYWGPGASGYTLLNYRNDVRFERLYGILKVGDLRVTGGDFHVTVGRGMALCLIKLDDVGLDNALRGGRLEYRAPRVFRLDLFGGIVNASNVDPYTHQVLREDPRDRVAGARVTLEPTQALALGFHVVYLEPRFTDEEAIAPDRMFIDQGVGVRAINGGGSVELHTGRLSVYWEGNVQEHDNYRPWGAEQDVENEPGVATLGEVSVDLAPFNVKAEGIYYRRWLMEGPLRGSASNIAVTQPISYNNLVTLEPMWAVNRSLGNEVGGRVTGDLYLHKSRSQFVLSANLLKYEGGLMPQGEWDDHGDIASTHPTLQVVQDLGAGGHRITVEGGYRHEWRTDGEPGTGHLWGVRGDAALPIHGRHGISVVAEVRRHQLQLTEGGKPYWLFLASAGYSVSNLLGVTVLYEYSDQTEGQDAKIGDWTLPLPRRHYLSLLASFQPPAPLDGLTIRTQFGTQRGGHKCAGGVCRDYPDSVGFTVDGVYRF